MSEYGWVEESAPPAAGQAVSYLPDIRAAHQDPSLLEQIYQNARKAHQAEQFSADMLACHREFPDNLLYAAWYYRFQAAAQEEQRSRHPGYWRAAIPLSLLMGLVCGFFEARSQLPNAPLVILILAPVGALFVIGLFTLITKQHRRRALVVGGLLLAVFGYVMLVLARARDPFGRQYLELVIWHLALLAWSAVGVSILGLRSSHENRFAFLSKSVEVLGIGGVYAIVVSIFATITLQLFGVVRGSIAAPIQEAIFGGGIGLVPLLAVTSVYDPLVEPRFQEFGRGLSKLIAVLMRVLLPLGILVLAIYLCFIPSNFMQPFRDREALIVYNVMLFAVMGLLIGVTPIKADELSPRYQAVLRAAILTLAVLVVVISLHALGATVYRTIQQGETMNRFVIIGWNSINIALLIALIAKQVRAGRDAWVEALQSVLSRGATAYMLWAAFVTVMAPFLFGGTGN